MFSLASARPIGSRPVAPGGLTHTNFKRVELHGEGRQRQLQIMQFLRPCVFPLIRLCQADTVLAAVAAADGACSSKPWTLGSCSIVARCPLQSCVTSTLLPSGNSMASW